MPSNASPNSLQIGPGRLPANVVSASAFQELGNTNPENDDASAAVVSVVKTTTLTRQGAEMYVLIDNRPRITAVAGASLVDGETFTVDDGLSTHTPTIFEFDSNGSVSGGNVPVAFTSGFTAAQVATAMRTAINSIGSSLSAQAATTIGEVVPLESSTTNELPILVTDTVANAGFTYFGFNPTNYTVTLPASPEIGDVVHLVVSTTTRHTRNVVHILGGANEINGGNSGEEFGGSFSGISYVFGPLGWVSIAAGPSIRWVAASTTLRRTSSDQVVLVDSTAGAVALVLPTRPMIGDRVTLIKAAPSANPVSVLGGSAFDTFDDQTTNAGSSMVMGYGSMTFVRAAQLKWVTLPGTPESIRITDTLTLNGVSSGRHINVLVATNDAAWAAGTRSVVFPSGVQTRIGTVITVTDIDGAAATYPILIGSNGPPPTSGVLGVSSPTGSANYTIDSNYGTVTLISVGTGSLSRVLSEGHGLVENFSGLVRADSRSDSAGVSRLKPRPLFNWSERRVAIHAEFSGLITNILPVDGFSAGGDMILSAAPGTTGTVGVLRCTVPLGLDGYIHLGNTPTADMFDPAQLMGFRAIVTLQSPGPGSNYDVFIGFGDDISANASTDHALGGNSLYLFTESAGNWRRVRQNSGTASGTTLTAATAGSRFVIEYYLSSAGWDSYINGVRSGGTLTNVPTAMLNFGMLIQDDGGGAVDHVVDVDSFTIFTGDMGNTRHNP